MTKLEINQLFDVIKEHNEDHSVKSQYSVPSPLNCVIVFKNESWPGKECSLESRSYEFRSDEKYFLSGMGGSSIFVTSLDKSDVDVRPDKYLNKWKVDYCYLR